MVASLRHGKRIRHSIFARVTTSMIAAGLVALAVSTVAAIRVVGDDKEAALADAALRRGEFARTRLDHRIDLTRALLQTVALAARSGRVDEVATLDSGNLLAVLCKRGSTVLLEAAVSPDDAQLLRAHKTEGEQQVALIAPFLLHLSERSGDIDVRALVDVAPVLRVPAGWELNMRQRHPGSAPAARRLTTAQRTVDPDGAERVRIFVPSENGIVLELLAPLEPARASVLAVTTSMVSWSALAVVPLVLLAWTLSRALTSPVSALAQAVRRAPATEIKLSSLPPDEIGDLGRAIVAMSQRVRYDAKALSAAIRFARRVVGSKEPRSVFSAVERGLRAAFPTVRWSVVPLAAIDDGRVHEYADVEPEALQRFVDEAGQRVASERRNSDPTLTQPLPVRATVVSHERTDIFVSLDTASQHYGVLVGRGLPDDATIRHCELYCRFAVVVLQKLELFDATLINEKLATLGRLSAGVAHEMNNPLTFVLANLRLLEADLQGDMREAAADAREGAERLARIVRDLSSLSKEPNHLSAEDADLVKIAQSAAKIARSRTSAVTINVTGDEHVPVRCDRIRIGQVLVNLLTNAQDACAGTPESGVVVRVTQRRTSARVEVEDCGPGVPATVQRRMFEAFFTSKPGAGTGLGLYLSRNLALAHGGSLELKGTGPEGSTFVLELPRLEPGVRLPASSPAPLFRSGRPSVLVLDDEEGVVRALERWLGRYADVVGTTDPEHALDLATRRDFSLVLCDLHMPRMTGKEFVKALRTHDRHLGDRVVIMTGTDVDRPRGMRVVDKPLSAELMSELLGVARISTPPPARYGGTG
ncbi:MAG: ATP-binding protein [Proteobacteria bacterium]|nr:ATP-binding protein [Pseudomonadota bacterium]